MAVFIDEDQIASLEKRMQERGYLEAHDMATSFNMLRANDLIWSFVVNNYLLGREQAPFDLLFWNSDSTRMPAAMHSFYLVTLSAEPAGEAGRNIPRRHADRPNEDQGADIPPLVARGPHCAVENRPSAAGGTLFSGLSNLSLRPRVTWLASSARRAASTAIGPTMTCLQNRTNGLTGRDPIRDSAAAALGRVGDAIALGRVSFTFAWRRQARGDRGRAWRLRPCTIRRLNVLQGGRLRWRRESCPDLKAWPPAPAAWDRSRQ